MRSATQTPEYMRVVPMAVLNSFVESRERMIVQPEATTIIQIRPPISKRSSTINQNSKWIFYASRETLIFWRDYWI